MYRKKGHWKKYSRFYYFLIWFIDEKNSTQTNREKNPCPLKRVFPWVLRSLFVTQRFWTSHLKKNQFYFPSTDFFAFLATNSQIKSLKIFEKTSKFVDIDFLSKNLKQLSSFEITFKSSNHGIQSPDERFQNFFFPGMFYGLFFSLSDEGKLFLEFEIILIFFPFVFKLFLKIFWKKNSTKKFLIERETNAKLINWKLS